MTEDELLAAVTHFADLCRQDADVAAMRKAILARGHESVGHFCRAEPEAFEMMYLAALEMLDLDAEFDKYVEIRGTRPAAPTETA